MNKKHSFPLTVDLVIYLGLVLLTFGSLLTGDTRVLGFSLMGWAFFSLSYIHKILMSKNMESVAARPVARLLKGITQISRDKETHVKEAGTRTSIGLLGVGGMLLSVEILYHATGYRLYEEVAFLCLCGLMFWATQSVIRHSRTAYIVLGIFTAFSMFYINDIWRAFISITGQTEIYASYVGGYFLMGVMSFVFLRALYMRHKHHVFALAGLMSSVVLLCMLAFEPTQQIYPALFALWGIISIAWTQSRPQSKVRHLIYSKNVYNS